MKNQLRVKRPNCFRALFSSLRLGFFSPLSIQDGRQEGSTWAQNSPSSQEEEYLRTTALALWEEEGPQLNWLELSPPAQAEAFNREEMLLPVKQGNGREAGSREAGSK